jgi:hypothetical protein
MRGEYGRNKIAKRFEETHKVKRRIYFVKWKILKGAISNLQLAISQTRRPQISADQRR